MTFFGGFKVWQKLCWYMSLPIFSFLNLSYFSFELFIAPFSSSLTASFETYLEGLFLLKGVCYKTNRLNVSVSQISISIIASLSLSSFSASLLALFSSSLSLFLFFELSESDDSNCELLCILIGFRSVVGFSETAGSF